MEETPFGHWLKQLQDSRPKKLKDWNEGFCMIMAVALHNVSGLPIKAVIERAKSDADESLVHAFVELPDGRALDAIGPQPMFTPADCSGTLYPGEESEFIIKYVSKERLSTLSMDIDIDAYIFALGAHVAAKEVLTKHGYLS